jgi:hypothetical protein
MPIFSVMKLRYENDPGRLSAGPAFQRAADARWKLES